MPKWGPRGTAAATFGARLTFENVSLAFSDVEAVKEVSFELHPGEIVCLLGPSGCGKTTLLRIAAGVERPQTGRVLLDGEEVAGPNAFVPPEKRNVGLMFQDFALFPHLSIVENVAFGLKSLDRKTALSEARLALRRVGLAEYENNYPSELSGGEQQRVALARAVVPRPAVVLMDEPFSGLDQRLRDSVRQETLAVLKETRASAVLVTHDPVEAMGMADRILLMRQGRLVQAGPPVELYHHPVDLDAARFFCDYNELDGTVVAGAVSTPLGDFAASDLAEGAAAVVLIRPQSLRIASRTEPSTPGHVVQSHFLGEWSELTIQFHGVDQPLVVRLSPRDAPKAGEIVQFSIIADDVLVFASGG